MEVLNNQEVGKRLKIFRISLPGKMTQKKMCQELGATQGTYSMYESGVRKIPNVIKKALEKRYRLNIIWLDTGEGEMFIECSDALLSSLIPLLNDSNRALLTELTKKIYVSQCHEDET